MKYSESTHTASDGKSIFVRTWLPSGAPKAVLLIAHGMAEHGARYERFASVMAEAGWAIVAPDHRGHGKTAASGELGWFADRYGFFRIRDDLHEIALGLRETYMSAPLFLYGHSMGSVLAETYIAAYGQDLSACALSGVVEPMAPLLLAVGKLIAVMGCLFKGQRKPAKMLDTMGFSAYNKDFEPARTKVDWLSRDPAEVDKYVSDPLCGFICSFGFYRDFFAGIASLYNKRGAFDSVPKSLPLYIFAGAEDPAGGAKGWVSRLAEKLKEAGVQSVETRLYPGARHEVLNETNRDEVMKDLRDWLDCRVARA
jgi:alpha-beta hydrolase superfamily lysophospholipase